jgi:hypothetical protein
MDEMFADVTQLVDAVQRKQEQERSHGLFSQDDNTSCDNIDAIASSDGTFFIYGDDNPSLEPTVLTEDQSGATVTIQHRHQHAHHGHDDDESYCDHNVPDAAVMPNRALQQQNQQKCQTRLWIAARQIAQVLQQRIYQQLGFTTTVGISVSPLLAKLASSTHKPDSLNLLYPWRATHLTLNMPLRKLPQLGRATYHALHSCLLQEFQQEQQQGGGGDSSSSPATAATITPPPFWTCRYERCIYCGPALICVIYRTNMFLFSVLSLVFIYSDLLQVPRDQIIKCLEQVKSLEKNRYASMLVISFQCAG